MVGIPDGYARGDYRGALHTHFNAIENVFEFAPNSRFLAAVNYAKRVDEDYGPQISRIKNMIATLETELINSQPGFEQRMAELLTRDPGMAQKSLREYCEIQLRRAEELRR
jgi:hypothetical protein